MVHLQRLISQLNIHGRSALKLKSIPLVLLQEVNQRGYICFSFVASQWIIRSIVEVYEVIDHLLDRLVFASKNYRQKQHVDDLYGLVPNGEISFIKVFVND